ncbi:small ribosomal subunit protein mS77 (rPPR2)-like [Cornus florida]|uniref:small ribosomal subunit protein mS77 (rPPR2)-like n=1 Tax=Cornus florida TaxID=4283 RepID=UPI00289D9C8D|nr:small ribosomal subunit protein mS77 (rPPR2)-like [Cornus florida]
MNPKHLISRLDGRILSPYSSIHRNASTASTTSPSILSLKRRRDSTFPKPTSPFNRTKLSDLEDYGNNVKEFLSRFVWIMRGRLSELYSDCDKQRVIDGLLPVIVSEFQKGVDLDLGQMLGVAVTAPSPSDDDFSEDLWRTACEVTDLGVDCLKKAGKKKDRVKGFPESEEVKEMCRSSGEEEVGLDISDPKCAGADDKMDEIGECNWPQEPKTISGKCKLVTLRILTLEKEDDPSPLLAKWVELLQPSRVDWITLIDRLKEQNTQVYFKVAEHALGEESFQTNICDYAMLIDAHAKENHLEDAERILKKMKENAIMPDILTYTALVHMYSKAGNLDRAKEAFEKLRSQVFQPDTRLYNSMILAYANAGQSKLGEYLTAEMVNRDMKPAKEIYMALLKS